MADPAPANDLVTGLFGGTFDPIHLGHLQVARQLLESEHLEQVIFIPAAVPPHKRRHAITPAEHRLAMLRLAIAGQPGCFVSDYELRAGGVSYTIDTVDHFRPQFGDRLRLVLGMDSLLDLHKWYRAAELVDRCQPLVYTRPGYRIPEADELAEHFGPRRGSRLAAAVVHAVESGISATAIRDSCRRGKDASGLVPPPVWTYIQANRLYQD